MGVAGFWYDLIGHTPDGYQENQTVPRFSLGRE